jgi:hypothetical protein
MAGVSQVLLANIQPLESQQVLLANIQPIYAANGEEILRTGIGTSPFKNSNFSDTLYVLKLLVNLTSVGNLLNIIFYLLLVLWVLCRIYKLEKWWARGIKQGRPIHIDIRHNKQKAPIKLLLISINIRYFF